MPADLNTHLGAKKRSLNDLIQFVRTRTENVTNYTMLLGAGASVTSGVRSASQLIEEWREELYARYYDVRSKPYSPEIARELFQREHAQWYSPQREYSSLFERKFDLPRQRRMFVENEVSGKAPSLGYAYLVRLVRQQYLNTLFTTNFDDLLNEAFHRFSDVRPIVCAHDSSISSITVTSRRPKIIKLHGDYLFDDIKSTVRETESLEENTKRKFGEFAKDHGLIVAGYSGHDRSVMDVLQYLLKQDEYFKHGIYWCVRESDCPSEELTKLLWRERAYWVPVEGFDELMAEIYRGCLGTELPVNTSLVSEKPREMIRGFCNDKFLQNSTCTVVQEHLKLFRQELDQEALVESFREVTKRDDDTDGRVGDLLDKDFIKLMSLRQKSRTGVSDEVTRQIDAEFSASNDPEFKCELLRLRLSVERKRNNKMGALRTCDALIELDPHNAFYFLERSRFEQSFNSKLSSLHRAIEIDPFYPAAFRMKAGLLEAQLSSDPSCHYEETANQVCAAYGKSLELDPSIDNAAWELLFDFLWASELPSNFQISETEKIIARVEALDAYSPVYFRLCTTQLVKRKGSRTDQADLFGRIEKALQVQPRRRRRALELTRLTALEEFERYDELRAELGKLDLSEEWTREHEYVELRARLHAQMDGKISEAIRCLSNFPRWHKRASTASLLVQYLCHAGKTKEARQAFDDCKKVLSVREQTDLERVILDATGTPADYEKLLALCRRDKEEAAFPAEFAVDETHQLLKLERPPEAEATSRKVLDQAKFSSRYDALVINYELAVSRQGRKPDKARLGRIAERNGYKPVSMCAYLLMDEKNKAAECLTKVLASDKSELYTMRNWAIFDTPALQNWLDENTRGTGMEKFDRVMGSPAVRRA